MKVTLFILAVLAANPAFAADVRDTLGQVDSRERHGHAVSVQRFAGNGCRIRAA